MSDMVKRWEESQKQRVKEARNIPGVATNFIDLPNEFQTGWTNLQKKGDPTTFTTKALEYYYAERRNIILNANFQPTEQGIDINRWSPDQPYHVPGAAGQ